MANDDRKLQVDLRRLILVVLISVSDLANGKRLSEFSSGSKNAPNPEKINSGGGECDTPTTNQYRPYSLESLAAAASTKSFPGATRWLSQSFSDECADFKMDFSVRTVDGECNHERNLGMAFTPMARLLPAAYDDGTDMMRATNYIKNGSLPSARKVSTKLHPGNSKPDESLTHMVMQWGQFVHHDIAAFPVPFTEDDGPILCCDEDCAMKTGSDESCYPIPVTEDDEHFNGTCMEFVRSLPATDSCGLKVYPREQINTVTSFLDGSTIYSSDMSTLLSELRDEFAWYKLKTVNDTFLPVSEIEECILEFNDTEDYCFLAGDSRVNEQPFLASLHTLFVREHNRIAEKLKDLRPMGGDDEIFNIARKIVVAIIQQITYREWLPIIIGNEAMTMYGLGVTERTPYSSDVDPRILNEVSTAAMRFVHTLIPGHFIIGDNKPQLRDLYNRPKKARENFDDILSGLAGLGNEEERLSESFDENFVDDVTKYLFLPGNGSICGLDLVALNIQRGRDHGIAPFLAYRALCDLSVTSDFDDREVFGDKGELLSKVYDSVDDIDLFTGLMYEARDDDREGGGVVGPTTACLLGMQFESLKFGDRFFFNTDNEQTAFNDEQLLSIQGDFLSRVICANTNIDRLPWNVFRTVGGENELKSCTTLLQHSLDLTLWASP